MTLLKHFSPSRVFSASSLISLVALAAIELSAAAQAAKTTDTNASHARQSCAKLPLSFEVNEGQADPIVRFLPRGDGDSLFLTDFSAVHSHGQPKPCNASIANAAARADLCSESLGPSRPDVVRMTLAGTSREAHIKISGDDQLPGKVNYFIGKDPRRWWTDLPTYAKVRYADVYPGVDLIYYGNLSRLEYDFVVAPGADPNSTRLKFDDRKRNSTKYSNR